MTYTCTGSVMGRYFVFKLGLTIVFYTSFCTRPSLVHALKTNEENPSNTPGNYWAYYQGVEGKPGIDFPVYSYIPRTTFNCKDVDSGYYADLDTDCQVFHICEDGKKISFLCPNGTIFQQSELICEWWFKVNCTNSPNLYEESAERLQNDIARRKSMRRVELNGDETNHGAIMRTEEQLTIRARQNGKDFKISEKNHLERNLNVAESNNRHLVNVGREKKQHQNQNDAFGAITKRNQVTTRNHSDLKEYHLQFSSPNSELEGSRHHITSTVPPSVARTTPAIYRAVQVTRKNFLNGDTEESQITQETSSFVKNKFNSLNDDEASRKSANTHENHRATYSDVKEPFYPGTKFSSISSITPQFVTTQPINNGKPFVGSRVGTMVPRGSAVPHGTEKPIGAVLGQEEYGPLTGSFNSVPHSGSSNSEPNSGSLNSEPHLGSLNPETYSSSLTSEPHSGSSNSEAHSGSLNTETHSGSLTSEPHSGSSNLEAHSGSLNSEPNSGSLNSEPHLGSLNPETYSSSLTSEPHSGSSNSEAHSGSLNSEPNSGSLNSEPDLGSLNTETHSGSLTSEPHSGSLNLVRHSGSLNSEPHSGSLNSEPNPGSLNSEPHLGSLNLEPHSGSSNSEKGGGSLKSDQQSGSVNSVPHLESLNSDSKNSISPSNSLHRVPPEGGSVTSEPRPVSEPLFVKKCVPLLYGNQPDYCGTTKENKLNTVPDTLFNVGTTDMPILTNITSTVAPINALGITVPVSSDLNIGTKINDHATVYGTYSTTPVPPPFGNRGVAVKFDKNSNKIGIHLSKSLGGRHRPLLTKSHKGTSTESTVIYTVPPQKYSVNLKTNIRVNESSVSDAPTTPSTYVNAKIRVTEPHSTIVGTQSSVVDGTSSGNQPLLLAKVTAGGVNQVRFESGLQPPLLNVNAHVHGHDVHGTADGFFVTKDSNEFPTVPSARKTIRPRPFQKSANFDDSSNSLAPTIPSPTFPPYKISSARPFALENKRSSTPPSTPLETRDPPSYENIDNMINVLMEIANVKKENYASETPRPGLVVPPSAGPQTLHSLAQYFANALEEIRNDDGTLEPETKEKFTALLTQMTVHGYNSLFQNVAVQETTTIQPQTEIPQVSSTVETRGAEPDDDENETQEPDLITATPELRKLARNFSLALSSYLNDPEMFRKDLESFRPTEPPAIDGETFETTSGDEELLNFSDADIKTNPVQQPLPTPTAPTPTWGFIIAPKHHNEDDIKNSLNPDLNTADSQSFFPKYNSLTIDEEKTSELPPDHWTTSPIVTKLWQSTLAVNPAAVNEHFDTSTIESAEETSTDDVDVPSRDSSGVFDTHEIKYEVKSLPKLRANNETQIRGILIDFMNSTRSERFQRLLKKLNTSEEEFLTRMRAIEGNPLTKRLVLLLISECATDVEDKERSASISDRKRSDLEVLVDPKLKEDAHDARALDLLNSLYQIASKFGK